MRVAHINNGFGFGLQHCLECHYDIINTTFFCLGGHLLGLGSLKLTTATRWNSIFFSPQEYQGCADVLVQIPMEFSVQPESWELKEQ